MIKCCNVYRLLFITAFTVGKGQKTAGVIKDPSILQIKHERRPQLFTHPAYSALVPLSCLPLDVLHHSSGGHVGLYKPPAGPTELTV